MGHNFHGDRRGEADEKDSKQRIKDYRDTLR